MSVHFPILKLGEVLIVTVQAALTDAELIDLRTELADRVGRFRAKGVVVDVSLLDVLDSFASRTLSDIAKIARLRGAQAIIVGIQPDAAFAMVQLGLTLEGVDTAVDLDEAMEILGKSDVRLRG
jgi:rsbT antagonist protein RsbS